MAVNFNFFFLRGPCFFFSLGLCWTAKTFPAHAGNQTEEAVRRRAGKKPAAVASQDSNFRPSRKLVLDQKSSPYFSRGEPSVNHPSGAALLGGKERGGSSCGGREYVRTGGRSSWCD